MSTNGYGIFWNNPSRSEVNNRFVHSLYLTAEVADQVDYYFLYGPEADDIIGHYRELTGEVPLFGRWAYGFWQCKNKYQSQKEVEGVAAKYRELQIPVDNIVQDWFWWVTMGEMKWNPNYPDPQGMIDTLHKEHFHLMVSVWPYFRPGSAVYDQFEKNGWFVAKTVAPSFHPVGQALYDATNDAARKQYWDNINAALFSKGVDAWWLDTDEPETEAKRDNLLVNHHAGGGIGCAVCECVSAVSRGRSERRAAGGVGQEAGVHSVAVGVCGVAEIWSDGLVGRCAERLADVSGGRFRRG